MKKIVFSGRRIFMKFGDLEYFEKRAKETGVKIVGVRSESDNELIKEITDASAVVVIARTLNAKTIERMDRCELILALSVGYDCIDVVAATKKCIPVCNMPVYCTDEVANHAMTLILSVARKIQLVISKTQHAVWDYNYTKPIFNFQDNTLGIIGLGRIGRRIVPKARGFGMNIVAHDPYLDDDIFKMLNVGRKHELVELLRETDYVTIHAPLTPETHHMIDRNAFESMKRTAIIVNTARGSIIDERALIDALKNGKISGAGIDVLETEPPAKDNPLLGLGNVIVTPHIAWYSEESLKRDMVQGMDEVVNVLAGHRPRYIVNPEIFGMRNENR
jgi:D-3-phosphoglycerate dehydrogenase